MVTKEDIIEAAAELFARKGYHDTSVEEIASACGLKKGSLYHHIAAKDDLLYEIHEACITDFLDRLKSRQAEGLTATEELRGAISDILTVTVDRRTHIAVFYRDVRWLSPPKFALVRSKRDEYESLLVSIFERGMETGEFKPLDPRMAAFALVGLCGSTYNWLRPDGRLPLDEIIEIYCTIVLGGIGQDRSSECTQLYSAGRTRAKAGSSVNH